MRKLELREVTLQALPGLMIDRCVGHTVQNDPELSRGESRVEVTPGEVLQRQ